MSPVIQLQQCADICHRCHLPIDNASYIRNAADSYHLACYRLTIAELDESTKVRPDRDWTDNL